MEQQQSTVHRVLSVIAYIRNFFSDKAFVSSMENGICMKTVRWSRETEKYMEWIKAIESEIENIHRVVLGVHDHKGEILEMYSIDVRSVGEIKDICIRLQKMSNLPRGVTIRIKVYSYVAIEMKGFKSGNMAWGQGNIKNIETVNGISIYSKNGDIGVKYKEDKYIENKYKENKDINTMYNLNNTSNNGDVRCICNIPLSDGDMLQCDMCNYWLHTVCAGYFTNQDRRIPGVYECLFCTDKVNNKHRNAGIYRRILSIIYNEGCCTQTHVKKRLGINNNYIAALYKKLTQDGLIRRSSRGYEVVTDEHAKEKVKKYFNGKILECSISVEEIPVD